MPLTLTESDGKLSANWTPDFQPDKAIDNLLKQVSQSSYLDLFALEFALEEFILHLKIQPDLPCSMIIAERRDAKYEIKISQKCLNARMFYSPAFGGKNINEDKLKALFKKEGFTKGIQPYIFQLISENPPQGHYLLAEGKAPQKGENTQFIPLVKESENKGKPRLKANQEIDFKDLQWITLVDIDTPLMKKTEPTSGEPGCDIYGKEIPPIRGKELPFGEGKGAKVCSENPKLLLAEKKGQINIFGDHVTVLDVLELPSVDLSSGHIHFPGTVIVHENINEGFKVISEGDIFVQGRVEGSTLSAQKEILIQQGVVGQKKAKLKSQELMQARFVEHAQIESLKDIFIVDQVLYSHLNSGDQIKVGVGNARGQVIGGKLVAKNRIEAKIAGSTAHTKTWLEVGECPFFKARQAYLDSVYISLQNQLKNMTKSLLFHRLKHRNSSLTEAIENLRHSLSIRLQEVKDQRFAHTTKKAINLNAKIYISERIYPGVTVKIGPYIRTFQTGFSGASIYVDLQKNELVLGQV